VTLGCHGLTRASYHPRPAGVMLAASSCDAEAEWVGRWVEWVGAGHRHKRRLGARPEGQVTAPSGSDHGGGTPFARQKGGRAAACPCAAGQQPGAPRRACPQEGGSSLDRSAASLTPPPSARGDFTHRDSVQVFAISLPSPSSAPNSQPPNPHAPFGYSNAAENAYCACALTPPPPHRLRRGACRLPYDAVSMATTWTGRPPLLGGACASERRGSASRGGAAGGRARSWPWGAGRSRGRLPLEVGGGGGDGASVPEAAPVRRGIRGPSVKPRPVPGWETEAGRGRPRGPQPRGSASLRC
jgi:hypothetical protein